MPLQSHILFSSTSGVWSQPGASHYAAANMCLDAVSSARQFCGFASVALQLGPFAGKGMAAEHVGSLRALGIHSLTPDEVVKSCQKTVHMLLSGPQGHKKRVLMHHLSTTSASMLGWDGWC